jgi:predicted enzyme related to lactoylglutathione lyase
MSDTSTTSKVVWFEVPAQDTARAKSFYGELLGWSFQPYDEQDYHTTYEAGGAVYGAPDKRGIVTFFGVGEIDAAIARVRELGGEASDKQEIPNIGFYSNCVDTEGNAFGLYQDGTSS